MVVVTHDRWFLDAVTERTWEVTDGQVLSYEGGYSAYVLARAERARLAEAADRRRRSLLRKELAWLRRGPPARTSKPKFRIEAATALIEDEPAAAGQRPAGPDSRGTARQDRHRRRGRDRYQPAAGCSSTMPPGGSGPATGWAWSG